MVYKVKLDSFEGPLDLLYQMVRENEIELNKISLAHLTEQYLEYTDYFQSFDLDMASEFMVIAGELIELKARLLLPDRRQNEEKQEKEVDLVARLREYEFFKNAAKKLAEFRAEAENIFFRPEEMTYISEDEYELRLNIEAEELKNIYDRLLYSRKVQESDRQKNELDFVHQEKYRVAEKTSYIREKLSSSGEKRWFFRDFIKNKKDFLEVVVTLLSILELVYLEEIKIYQDNLFTPIEVIPVEECEKT